MPDSQDDMLQAILARYRDLCADHEVAQENIALLQEHQRDLSTQIGDCIAAARLFGFDLSIELRERYEEDTPEVRVVQEATSKLSSAGSTFDSRRSMTIRSVVLEAAEKAYPKPIRATDIRKDLAANGYIVHEKTVGMTLYRWSQKGRVRRIGRDWYFVPEPERHSAHANGQRYAPIGA